MDKFFSVFGKIVLVIFILAGMAGAGFYAGKFVMKPTPPSISVTPTPTPSGQVGLPTTTPTQSVTKQTVVAGVSASAKLSFVPYSIDVPNTWLVKDDKTDISDTLTLTKGSYQIKIYQAPTGGAMCFYPGQTPTEGPSSLFDSFTEITTADGTTLRRSGTTATKPDGTRSFTACQKASDGRLRPTNQIRPHKLFRPWNI